MDGVIYPASSFHIIQTCDNNRKLIKEQCIKVLNRLSVCFYLNIRATISDELRGDLRLELRDVFFAEQKLSIQIGYVDSVKVDH